MDNLSSLDSIDGLNGTEIYLTAHNDIGKRPRWVKGSRPDSSGATTDAVTCAVIVNNHGGGLVDFYYMYFYGWNQGTIVLGADYGNRLGDWEHNMVRFQNGTPTAVWYSQHNNGEAFTYDVVAKYGSIRVSVARFPPSLRTLRLVC